MGENLHLLSEDPKTSQSCLDSWELMLIETNKSENLLNEIENSHALREKPNMKQNI